MALCRRSRRCRRPRGRIDRNRAVMARDPRAAGGAGEGEMGGEAAIREVDGSPFFW